MWTSVPHTSEYSVCSRTDPDASDGSANSRNSTGARGALITAAVIPAVVEWGMPFFECKRRGGGRGFDSLTRKGQSPACPSCHGVELQKLMSVFAAQASGPGKSFVHPPAGPCGSC